LAEGERPPAMCRHKFDVSPLNYMRKWQKANRNTESWMTPHCPQALCRCCQWQWTPATTHLTESTIISPDIYVHLWPSYYSGVVNSCNVPFICLLQRLPNSYTAPFICSWLKFLDNFRWPCLFRRWRHRSLASYTINNKCSI